MPRPPTRLWPLALLVAVVPALAVHVAWAISLAQGFVPACVPYLDGCTSISRAARHGDANLVFQGMMLPCALLQFLHWYAMRSWLHRHHPAPRAGRSLVALGAVAGVALAVYVTFLGTEGPVYGWLRRYGVIFYFAATYMAQLVLVHRLDQMKPRMRGLHHVLAGLCIAMLAIGLANVALPALVEAPAKDRLENVLEWNFALLMSATYLAHAVLWRRTGFALTFDRTDRIPEPQRGGAEKQRENAEKQNQ